TLPTAQLRGMLALKRAELAQTMRDTAHRLAEVEARLAWLEQGNDPSPYEVVVKSVPEVPVASLRQLVPHAGEMGYYCQALTRALYRKLTAAAVSWSGPELILYHADEYRETDLDVEVCVALPAPLPARPPRADADVTFRVLPAYDLVGALIYEGPFAEMTTAVLELVRWSGIHQHVPVGPLREIHLSGPAHPLTPTAGDPVVELQYPIARIDVAG
ncbi:MAG: GyrI-like domain-containing protein, partial [Anaerolineales bacterium]|nr:GyrI-like domain-containing protein [Anaerolineales bacterium]